MAAFKCKMCGGALEIAENQTTAVCTYCGTIQTLPRLTDEKKVTLFDRANHFRRNNEFDKAAGIYEQILNEDNTDAESYWSLVLCKYGIEYVEDTASGKRKPTVNRAQFTSIFNDDNYKSAIKYADVYQKAIYEEEANTINEIQKGILEISQKEEPFDVFICYKETDSHGQRTMDSVLANELYHELTEEGFKVFFSRITLEDKLGVAYEPYIFAALNSSKVMVVLGTKPEYFNAPWVKNEWSRYLSLVKESGGKKVIIPAYRDMSAYDLPEEFSHLQAQDMSKLGFMQDLIRGINKLAQPESKAKPVGGAGNVATIIRRIEIFLDGKDWNNANIYCEKALDIDPENASVYLYKLMARVQVSAENQLVNSNIPLDGMLEYKNAVRFSDEETAARLIGYNDVIVKRNAQIEAEQTARAQAEARHQDEVNSLIDARIRTTETLTSLVYEKGNLENLIFNAQQQARRYENPTLVTVLSVINIFITFMFVSLLFGMTGGFVVFFVPSAVITGVLSKMDHNSGSKNFGLIILDFFTLTFYGGIQGIILISKCKRQKSILNGDYLNSLRGQLADINASIDNARHSLLTINNKLENVQ